MTTANDALAPADDLGRLVGELVERMGIVAVEFEQRVDEAVAKNAAGEPHRLADHIDYAFRTLDLKDLAKDISGALRRDRSSEAVLMRLFLEVIAFNLDKALDAITRSIMQPTDPDRVREIAPPLAWAMLGADQVAKVYQESRGNRGGPAH